MKLEYGHKPALTLIGFSTMIRPDEGYIKCPEFWDKEYSKKYARLFKSMVPETPMEQAILENGIGMLAICDEKEDGFAYWIAGIYKGGEVPEGLALYTFPESDWAMFSAKAKNLPEEKKTAETRAMIETYGKRVSFVDDTAPDRFGEDLSRGSGHDNSDTGRNSDAD